jgi:hypothetical protein
MTKEIPYFIHNKDVAFYVQFVTQKQKRTLASRNTVYTREKRTWFYQFFNIFWLQFTHACSFLMSFIYNIITNALDFHRPITLATLALHIHQILSYFVNILQPIYFNIKNWNWQFLGGIFSNFNMQILWIKISNELMLSKLNINILHARLCFSYLRMP